MSSWEEFKEKGNEEFKKKNYNAAIALYNEAIELNSNQEALFANRGTCQKCLGNLKLALLDYEKALNINPNNTKNIRRKAELYITLGNLTDALSLYTKCINLDRNDRSFKEDYIRVKNLLEVDNAMNKASKEKNFAKAEELAKRLIDNCPNHRQAKLMYINSLLHQDKSSEALKFISNLTGAEKVDEEFHYLTCMALYHQGS